MATGMSKVIGRAAGSPPVSCRGRRRFTFAWLRRDRSKSPVFADLFSRDAVDRDWVRRLKAVRLRHAPCLGKLGIASVREQLPWREELVHLGISDDPVGSDASHEMIWSQLIGPLQS